MAENLPDNSDKITETNDNDSNGGNDENGKDDTKNGAMRGTRGKICQVCGDKALGYNFNAITCESCKAFFRRNALNKKEFTCPFNQNCDITVVTRRFCQKCRLSKCFTIGMKKEYIMSEADKAEKRKKIEMNRAKRQLNNNDASHSANSSDVESPTASVSKRIKCEDTQNDETSASWSVVDEPTTSMQVATDYNTRPCSSNGYESCSPNGVDHNYQNSYPATPAASLGPGSCMNMIDAACQSDNTVVNSNITAPDLSPSEIVNRIISVPEKSSQSINQLMATQQDALKILSIVITSPTDSLRLIDHFIAQPGDALTIISKIMNSALDALSVFIQFMSSPTDALQIINKIMNSPEEVLQFIQQLMKYPQDALDIMTKFMNEPAEALKMINRMINNEESPVMDTSGEQSEHDMLRKSVEGNLIKSIISTNTMEVGPALEGPPPQTNFNPFSSYANISYPSTSVANTCSELLGPSVSGIPTSYHHRIQSNGDCDRDREQINECGQSAELNTISGNTDHCADSMSARSIRASEDTTGTATSSTTPEDRTRDILEEVENKAFQPYTIESIICEAIKVEYACFSSNSKSRELNDAERAKLNELIVANKALYAPVDEDWANLISDSARLKSGNNGQNTQLLTVINLTAIAIRRLIKMSKKISAFKNMCQEDQVALLKGGCVEMMILRSVMQYDCDRATWKIPHSQEEMSNIKADVLKLAKGNVYQEHERFIETFEKKWRQDENIILIMCAITLFTHDRPRTVHIDVIKLEQNSYYYLLRRYLESVYPGCEAKSTFLKLIKKINELHKLNETIVNVYLDVNPAQVEPLLREIFDLKVNMT